MAAKRQEEIRARIAFGVVCTTFTSMAVPFYTRDTALRWALLTFSIGVSLTLATFAQISDSKPKRRGPRSVDNVELVERLTTKAIERADRTQVGWLTIVGATHSAFIAAAASSEKLGTLAKGGSGISMLGAGLMILGVVCYAAHHAITTTRAQATRALSIACRLPRTGPFFGFVYSDEQSTSPISTMLTSLLSTMGYVWMIAGIMFALLGYLVQAFGPPAS